MADERDKENWRELCDLILNDPLNADTVNGLLDQIRKPTGVLPFVGAGLSVPLGLPGWTRFLLDGADQCGIAPVIEAHIQEGRFEEAAEQLYKALGWGLFERRLGGAFHKQSWLLGSDLAIVQVPGLTNGPVITTNFDRALEEVFRAAGRHFTDVCWGNTADRLTAALVENSRVLLKMHGDVLERQGRVLTLTEYQAHYGTGAEIDWERPLPQFLRRVLENRHALFVGCSLQHDRTLKVVHEVSRKTGLLHYALVETPPELPMARRAYLSDRGILSIFFPRGRFDTLAPFLAHLASLRSATDDQLQKERPAVGPERAHAGGSSHKTSGARMSSFKPETQSREFWAKRAWHHQVHQHFHEKLSYYLVRLRPFLRGAAVAALEKLVSEDELGTVRAFNLFGTYDLLIWAWLPNDYQHNFEQRLTAVFTGLDGVETFTVTELIVRSYPGLAGFPGARARSPLLSDLDERTVQDVQSGLRPQLFQQLWDAGMIFESNDRSHQPIIFFILINFERALTLQSKTTVADRLAEYFTGHPSLHRVYIDRCHGICEFLVKAEAYDYFTITEVPDWISQTFASYEATTETFLSKAPSYIFGSGKIGMATLAALGGRDIFVWNLIPEVYARRTDTHRNVEAFVKGTSILRDLGPGARKLTRAFLDGVLRNGKMDSGAVLFKLFGEVEDYLRDTHQQFAGKLGKNPSALYEETKIPRERWKKLSLTDLLQFLSKAISSQPQAAEIGINWTGLVEVRNAIDHNDWKFGEWESLLNTVLQYWARLNRLIHEVEGVTGEIYSGTYREE
jgi:hypothetical protein